MRLTVAELPEYLRAATRLMADADRRAIVDHLAAHPQAGDLIEGTGGVQAMPLYLLTMFAKNERANLSRAERNELADLVDVLVQIWLER
jgi:hypothetical protein